MTQNLQELPARSQSKPGVFHVVVESPRGSSVKLKYNSQLGIFQFSRPLLAGLHYPFDWGFVPGTHAPDGDPLDAMIFFDGATYPGVVVECRPVGVIRLTQKRKSSSKRERNDRLLAVPIRAPRFERIREPADIPARWREEIENFFLAAVRFENKQARLLGWGDAKAAQKLVDQAIRMARA